MSAEMVDAIIIAGDEAKLDANIKNILAFKPILARIFKSTIEECSDLTYDEIERCIEGSIDISLIGLNPGISNSKIEGRNQEDYVYNEGQVTYDIRTILNIPQKDSIGIKLLVDVEAQKDDTPGYDVPTRALFYCARMLSSQLSIEFTNGSSDKIKYGNIKKVYSIWICTEVAQYKANTIERYTISRSMLYGKEPKNYYPKYDLLEAIIVNISAVHDYNNVNNSLIRMLTVLFNEELSSKEKIRLLTDEYSVLTTDDFKREVEEMTAYTANIERRGYEKGNKQGIEKGEIIGREKEIFQSVQEGDYSISRGAEKLGLSVDDFEQKMQQNGYKVPVV